MILIELKSSKIEKAPANEPLVFSIVDSLKTIKADAILKHMTILAMGLKVFLMGYMPFLVFVLENQGIKYLPSLTLVASGLGLALGSVFYRQREEEYFSSLVNTIIIILIALMISITLLKLSKFLMLMPLLTFLMGYVFAASTVLLRTIRALKVDSRHIHKTIVMQGLLVRIVAPLSGVVFAAIFSKDEVLSLVVSSTCCFISVIYMLKIYRLGKINE